MKHPAQGFLAWEAVHESMDRRFAADLPDPLERGQWLFAA